MEKKMKKTLTWEELFGLTTIVRCGKCDTDHAPVRDCPPPP